MLHFISWYQFITALLIISALYYACGGLYFYLHEIKSLLKGESPFASRPTSQALTVTTAGGMSPSFQQEESPEDVIGVVADLIEDIKSLLVKTDSFTRESMTVSFAELLARYPTLVGTHYQETISLFIADTLSDKVGYAIDRSQVEKWWPAQHETEKKSNDHL